MSTPRVTIEPPRFDRPEVEVRASTRRTKTGAAHWSGTRIIVQIPARLRGRERTTFVDDLVTRLLAQRPQHASSDADLLARCRSLGATYLEGVEPAAVRWSASQRMRWASCSPATREIRVSSRLRSCPPWVVDAVLVHELAHLIEADHSPRFRALAARYPRQHEAAVYLEGYALGLGLASEGGAFEAGR